jgi:hypothetical protein
LQIDQEDPEPSIYYHETAVITDSRVFNDAYRGVAEPGQSPIAAVATCTEAAAFAFEMEPYGTAHTHINAEGMCVIAGFQAT